MVCNGTCDSFVMVLYISVMVLWYFSAGLHHIFLHINLSHFKGWCWPRPYSFYNHNNFILILLCILLFEVKNKMVKLWLLWLQEL